MEWFLSIRTPLWDIPKLFIRPNMDSGRVVYLIVQLGLGEEVSNRRTWEVVYLSEN